MLQRIEPLILLVDDEPAVLSIFTSGLTHAGFRVIAAQTAGDALQRATKLGRVDLLATDIVLPDRLRLAKDHLQRPVLHGIGLMRRLVAL
jgi:CheY-like chemotaxis protein